MYKDFKSKFNLLAEEETSRYKTGGGLLMGDYIIINKSVFKNPKLKGRPSQFFDKIKEIMASDLPLKVSTIKSMRPETSNGLYGGAEAPDEYFVDVIQCVTPALWVNPITLPIEVLELQKPDGNNFAPEGSESWEYDDRSNVNAKELKNKTGEDTKVTKVNDPQRNMTTKNTKGLGKSAKDGRSQTSKPKKYKESVELNEEVTRSEKTTWLASGKDNGWGWCRKCNKWGKGKVGKEIQGTGGWADLNCTKCGSSLSAKGPKKESLSLDDAYGQILSEKKWNFEKDDDDTETKADTSTDTDTKDEYPHECDCGEKYKTEDGAKSCKKCRQYEPKKEKVPMQDSYVTVLEDRNGSKVLVEEKIRVPVNPKDKTINFDKTDTNLLEEAYGNVAQDGSEPSFVENDDDRITDIYSSMIQDLTEATRIEELTGNDDQASKDPRYSDSDPKSWGGAMARRGLDNPNKFTYHINLNERGSFYADVRDPDGKTVYEIKAGNELPEDETDIFEDGFMDNTKDLVGLRDYLVQLGILTDDSELVDGNIG